MRLQYLPLVADVAHAQGVRGRATMLRLLPLILHLTYTTTTQVRALVPLTPRGRATSGLVLVAGRSLGGAQSADTVDPAEIIAVRDRDPTALLWRIIDSVPEWHQGAECAS
jgi:hypothetical protein